MKNRNLFAILLLAVVTLCSCGKESGRDAFIGVYNGSESVEAYEIDTETGESESYSEVDNSFNNVTIGIGTSDDEILIYIGDSYICDEYPSGDYLRATVDGKTFTATDVYNDGAGWTGTITAEGSIKDGRLIVNFENIGEDESYAYEYNYKVTWDLTKVQ